MDKIRFILYVLLFQLTVFPLPGFSAPDTDTPVVEKTVVEAAKGDKNVEAKKKKKPPEFFAKVGEQVLSVEDYFARLQYGIRQRYFHAKVPDAEMKLFRKEVGGNFINRVLLVNEAKKQGIEPDKAYVDHKISRLEQKRQQDKYWQENKEKLLPGVREEYEHDTLVKRLEENARKVADPSEKDIKAYFKNNPEKFTIPQRLRLTNILLKVDPSSGSDVWRAATDEAGEIVKKLRGGADFAQLARIHSSDDTASNGGDMGYVHMGMLAKPAQQIIDLMDPGDISEPIILLQGVAIFRLDERVKSKLNDYDRIKDTAKGLLKRQRGEEAWIKLIKDLRKNTKIEVNEEVYDL